jgi:hypothetical protein
MLEQHVRRHPVLAAAFDPLGGHLAQVSIAICSFDGHRGLEDASAR